uniref:GPI mannosyltransferase 2 n=1 Tax=Trichobilharzia regenti TaxID=157069 RepID=A0AA85KJ03_TRIRE|nr:unnamed protein product [Trichobilharzia regenti]
MLSLTGIEISLLKWAFVLKCVFTLLIVISSFLPDHDADAFKSPQQPHVGWIDQIILVCFQGFHKWDSVYFTFIAENGYVYEQSLAFFPGFPMLIGLFGRIVTQVCLRSISLLSSILICGFLLNFTLCVAATVFLYRLGVLVLGSSKISFLASILFCCNPAVVFFSSLYSESLFFFLTILGLYLLAIHRTLCSSLLIAFSVACRSNGLLNIGYLGYFLLARSDLRVLVWIDDVNNKQKTALSFILHSISWWINLLTFFLSRLLLLCLCALPFLIYQFYGYLLYCVHEKPFYAIFPSEIPMSLLNFGIDHDYIMPSNYRNMSTSNIPAWCSFIPPFSYTYIQEKWDVGLWKYYQLRQIPNFILAMPVIILCFVCSIVFYRRAPSAYRTLGLHAKTEMDRNMVPYVFHMLFLCAYGVLHINVQVLTRMIFSSCPIVYWFSAYLLREAMPNFEQLMKSSSTSNVKGKFAFLFNDMISICRIINPFQYHLLKHRIILLYFIGYACIGCIMHSNFLPWT